MLTYKNPKAKPCEVCERLFVPDRMGQVVCRPACAMKKVRQEKVEERAKIKTRREKAKTTGQRKAEAQAASQTLANDYQRVVRWNLKGSLQGHYTLPEIN